MTVCAAAIYSQGSAHAIMGISDRMITSWDVEYEPENHTKIFVFPSRPTEPYKIIALGGMALKDFATPLVCLS